MARKPSSDYEDRAQPLKRLKLLNEKQEHAWEVMKRKQIVFLIGSTGSGKTFLPTAYACFNALRTHPNETAQKIYLTRPTIGAGEDLGFLPGELKEKYKPFMDPIYNAAKKIFGEKNYDRLALDAATELVPISYMRGWTFDNGVAILDEAQNVTSPQLKLWLTRMGENCKMFIAGDPEQADIRDSALMDYVKALRGMDEVGVIKFNDDDIVRNGLISAILDATRGL